ncbi:MAG: diphthine--ammonia ligase [Chitinophagales bacterium]
MSKARVKAALFWSGGKDAAASLHQVMTENVYEVCYLITTLNAEHRRISIHGVREALLDQQAIALGIPLKKMWVRKSTNEHYEMQVVQVLDELKLEGIHHIIYGDIFLEDIRSYREKLLERHGLTGVFPLWKRDSEELIISFLEAGFRAVICCVNANALNESFAGREISKALIKELPSGVDPCGENGEYHSFVFDGPIFRQSVKFFKGEKIFKPLDIKRTENVGAPVEGFWFVDLIPV